MTIYNWLCLLGVPTLLAVAGKVVYTQIKSVRLGIQALLRAQMISDYNKWMERGWAPIYAKENFENCYVQYHGLGANGVMDDIRTKFLALPTQPPDDEAKGE